MNYPKKIEIIIENDAQAALLYSCFNHSPVNVIENMRILFALALFVTK